MAKLTTLNLDIRATSLTPNFTSIVKHEYITTSIAFYHILHQVARYTLLSVLKEATKDIIFNYLLLLEGEYWIKLLQSFRRATYDNSTGQHASSRLNCRKMKRKTREEGRKGRQKISLANNYKS